MTESKSEQEDKKNRPIRSYVLRQGRMGRAAERLLEEYGPRFCVPVSEEPLDFPVLFGGRTRIVLEIGFGMGEGTGELAKAFPDTGFLGVEVYTPGICRLLGKIVHGGIDNIRIIQSDAVPVVQRMIPSASLSGIHLFFPDPWPKKRHHKRRLLTEDFLTVLAERLCDGGYLCFATDWEDYAREVLSAIEKIPSLHNPFGGFADRLSWRPMTSFERKGIREGRTIRDIYVEKQIAP